MTPAPLSPFEGWDIRTLIDRQAAAHGDRTWMTWEPFAHDGQDEARTWTFASFHHTIQRFAAGLQARGVTPGQRVLVHLDNCPEAVIAWLGCAYTGAVAVTTNAKSSRDEIAYFAAHSGAVGAITQPRFVDLVQAAAPDLPWLAATSTDNGAPPTKFTSNAEPFSAIDAEPARLIERPHDPWAPFGIQYTSGTTARPKAVLWTHANALWGLGPAPPTKPCARMTSIWSTCRSSTPTPRSIRSWPRSGPARAWCSCPSSRPRASGLFR